MQANASARYVRMSPTKVRRVVELVKGKNVEEALTILHYSRKNAALPLSKTIRSAFHNLSNVSEDERFEMNNVRIKEIFVDGGPVIKRFRAMSMGRAGKIRKRTSHITVTVEF